MKGSNPLRNARYANPIAQCPIRSTLEPPQRHWSIYSCSRRKQVLVSVRGHAIERDAMVGIHDAYPRSYGIGVSVVLYSVGRVQIV